MTRLRACCVLVSLVATACGQSPEDLCAEAAARVQSCGGGQDIVTPAVCGEAEQQAAADILAQGCEGLSGRTASSWLQSGSANCKNAVSSCGPFTPDLVARCKERGGGGTCYGASWKPDFFAYIQRETFLRRCKGYLPAIQKATIKQLLGEEVSCEQAYDTLSKDTIALLDGSGTYDLSILELFPQYVTVQAEAPVISAAPLKYLRRLKELQLGEVQRNDLAAMGQAPSLTHLKLGRAAKIDLAALPGLAAVGVLQLEGGVTSAGLTHVGRMKNLKELGLVGAGLTSLNVLSGLSKLESLDVAKNKLTSIDPIKSLTSLEWLCLSENQIDDITPVSSLKRLKTLAIQENRLVSLGGLSFLPALKELYLTGNKGLKDLGQLMDLPALEEFLAADTAIDNVTPLANLHGLRSLGLSRTPVSSLSALKSTPLRKLYINGVPAIDPKTVVSYWPNLEALAIGQRSTNPLPELVGLKGLRRLAVPSSKVYDIKPLLQLPKLGEVALSDNPVGDDATLKGIKTLHVLEAANTNLTRAACPQAEQSSATDDDNDGLIMFICILTCNDWNGDYVRNYELASASILHQACPAPPN